MKDLDNFANYKRYIHVEKNQVSAMFSTFKNAIA
jgi:hypothetical protein